MSFRSLFFASIFLLVGCSSSDDSPIQNPIDQVEVISYSLSTSASPAAGGTVVPSAETYEAGTSVSVSANAAAEYVFLGWSGDASGTDNPVVLSMNQNKTVTALFQKRQYALSVTVAGQGTVSETLIRAGKSTDYNSGSEVRLTATPDTNWEFISWTGGVSSTTNPLDITIDQALQITAIFSEIASTTTTDDSTTATSTTATSTTSTATSGTSSDTSATNYTTQLTTFANDESGFGIFTKKVLVFDVPLYTTDEVSNEKLEHAAHVMAQYLDNDEDGTPDNPLVVDKMIENHAFMLVWNNESDLNIFESLPYGNFGQDLGSFETNPVWHTDGRQSSFDATLEEVLHLITQRGYAEAYPQVFGENIGSSIANAMDVARGGQFTSVPSSYPAQAWYTYDDDECDYSCQITEYTYWALTSILGAHSGRASDIGDEWALHTLALIQQTDPTVYQLLTNTSYGFPTVLPDGNYQR